MNGNGAAGVHDQMESIVTSDTTERVLDFEGFFGGERARLLRALYLLTGNREEAEEVLQESFVAVWERWARVGAMEDPTGYLYRTAWCSASLGKYEAVLSWEGQLLVRFPENMVVVGPSPSATPSP